jgi:hypothetical protein
MKHSPTVTGSRCRFTRAISGAALYWRMGLTASPTSLQARRAEPALVFVARASRLWGNEIKLDLFESAGLSAPLQARRAGNSPAGGDSHRSG